MPSAPHAPFSAPDSRRLVVTMDSGTSGWELLAPGGADDGIVTIGSCKTVLPKVVDACPTSFAASIRSIA